MNKVYLFLATLALSVLVVTGVNSTRSVPSPKDMPPWQYGDIIFQKSRSRQCEAVKLATGSEWTHCGILVESMSGWKVLEAVEPVCYTPLDEFVARSGGWKSVEVKHLKNYDQIMSDEVKEKMDELDAQWLNKHYDLYFNWSDDEMYCSELVWKMYHFAFGTELCPRRKLGEYDLSHPLVQAIMDERYGDDPPIYEPMVAPVDIYNSFLLETVPYSPGDTKKAIKQSSSD